MEVVFDPAKISGFVSAPASKSYTQRVIACALLADGNTTIRGYTGCDDSERALLAAKNMGALIHKGENYIQIDGGHHNNGEFTLDFGGSATSMRIFTSVSCVTPGIKHITGSPQLLRRPIRPLIDALTQLGAKIETSPGYSPPLIVHPTGLRGGEVELDASISSQFTSSIMVGSTRADTPTFITHTGGVVSRGYIRITAHVLEWFGANTEISEEFNQVEVHPSRLKPIDVKIEGDYSSAAFLLAAGAIGGHVEVGNLNPESLQPDREVLNVLKGAGCYVELGGDTAKVGGDVKEGFDVDVTETPDLAPILGVIAAYAKGESRIRGVSRLVFKESNRIDAVVDMLKSIGVDARFESGEIRVKGGGIRGGLVDSHGDHRIALAAAVAAVGAHKPIVVRGFECYIKSYPHFLEDYTSIGGRARVVQP
ncbi:3-phosphoshikimate 1-carboxyvinyltransferase [Candidatus Marsarchaeota G2 archaeon ECH_B_2]|uniref:3-phosphoshikimate 1-carboxyvinyltransferase n=3 Tax=Candidatus Marsarchaeota group 2 TaxID=2203771 RepID=A0A2R6B9G1_9ARCH|nr:MAG: 3-phosphoshikimate 1-carboxyvinyltransferase [Candidatus Marsarchaeota G2 archaeon ECH_B_2]PSN99859.1 MAG: 3-phosphoshikimate 1-carboxyvinyltransferase [Candidatus Marsarchaeota G2 archaeon ECH_B_3]PSO02056.1 MAG: 3-phosphoshikimate 1-carboxyvinyltransferase [Candidatus Marsarchaeota G2 archaeon ECH_B_1]